MTSNRQWPPFKLIPVLVTVIDGDTYRLHVESAFRGIDLVEVRLHGWDTPEKQGPLTNAYEREQGKAATALARAWFAQMIDAGHTVWIKTDPDPEKYGRWLGTIWAEDKKEAQVGPDLGATLGASQLASVYDPNNGHREKWRDVYGRP